MAKINAYLTFNGNCREAMTFYQSCFDGDLTLETVKGSQWKAIGQKKYKTIFCIQVW
jgi:uncharacterized glyoxalase superfamily protein PhnB